MMLGQLMKALPLVKALDADSDGELSTIEIENASKSLMKLDTNGDGKISADELKPNPADVMPGAMAGLGRGGEGRPGMGGEMLARMFEQRDANSDGMLSGEEIPERLQAMVGRVDKNGDGNISKDEFKQVQAGMMERMRDGQGAGGRRGGEEGDGPAKPKRPN
jgi:Ca2+-binding EF-hand superfamily protein